MSLGEDGRISVAVVVWDIGYRTAFLVVPVGDVYMGIDMKDWEERAVGGRREFGSTS